MTALEFVRTAQRRARARGLSATIIAQASSPEAVVKHMETWAAEHPGKTRQDELLKLLPNARMGDDGVLDLCPMMLDTSLPQSVCPAGGCHGCQEEFWLEEIDK